MAIKFPLKMKNDVEVRDLESLRENFDLEKIIGYFMDGKLAKWLEARYYDDELKKVQKLEKSDELLAQNLCEIFDVKHKDNKEINYEVIVKRNERITKLKQFTDDIEILADIDNVVFNQEELADLYDKEVEKIYLCHGEFAIPKSKQNIEYILIGEPRVKGLRPNKIFLSDSKDEEIKLTDKISDCLVSRSNVIFEKLADVIGANDYVSTDDYVVFTCNKSSFKDDLPLLAIDEDSYNEKDKFRIWDTKREKILSFNLIGYDNYKDLVGATENKIILSDAKNLLIYDILTKEIKLIWSDLSYGDISVFNNRVAFVDSNYNLYYVNLDTYEKIFVANIDNRSILLDEDLLFYLKEESIYQYDLNNKQSNLIQKTDYTTDDTFYSKIVDSLMKYDNKLYIFIKEGMNSLFFYPEKITIFECDLNNSDSLKEIFTTKLGKHRDVKKEVYYIFLKEEPGYPVYVFNAITGETSKVLSNCGYTNYETHWFKSDDVYHHGYDFRVVGNYLFYNKSSYSDWGNIYRLNLLTGEHISQKEN